MNQILSLEQIINKIRFPAGAAYTPNKIAEEKLNFLAAFNDGFKSVHMSLISEMMVYETVIERIKKTKSSSDSPHLSEVDIDTIKSIIQAARRANDAIAWIMLGLDRNTIKRLCYSNPKGNLKNQNPESVLATLSKLNSDRFNLAIWTDTTSSIDLGDILLANVKEHNLACIEIKDGKMNEIIRDVLESGNTQDVEEFIDLYGFKGEKQLRRVENQIQKYQQSLTILKENKGIDPIYREEISVVELITPDTDYHAEVNRLMDAARIEGFSITVIDECLWLLAINMEEPHSKSLIHEFSSTVIAKEGDSLRSWLREFTPSGDCREIYPLFNLQQGMDIPESLPIYLFGISELNVHDLIMSKIRVFSFISWPKFAELFKMRGAMLSWSSKKAGRREKSKPGPRRCYVVEDRIPIVSIGANEVYIGPGTMTRMIYDCTRPTCIVDQHIEAIRQSS